MTYRDDIYAVLDRPMTAKEIQVVLGMSSPDMVRRRLYSLEKWGKVERYGYVSAARGNTACLWRRT